MSIERETFTKIWCDMDGCSVHIQWSSYVSKSMAEGVARVAGWRKDKLNRNVCPAHPKLKGARNA
jgi:hypothetical protein